MSGLFFASVFWFGPLKADSLLPAQFQPTRGTEAPRATLTSIRRVPQDDEPVVAVIARGLGEVGVEPTRPELGCGQAERYVLVAGGFGAAVPTRTDLNVAGVDPVVGMDIVGLAGIRCDGDLGTDAEGLELALEGAVFALGDISDGRHCRSPCLSIREPFPGRWADRDGRDKKRPNPKGPQRKRRTGAGEIVVREEPLCGGEESRPRWFREVRPAVGHGLRRRECSSVWQ
nr:hypothetical protein [Leptolyngbya sp. 7M]